MSYGMEKTGGGTAGDRVEDVEICVRSDNNVPVWSGMSTTEGQRRWDGLERESTWGKAEVVLTRTEERCGVYSKKDADDGAARKEETGRPKRRFMDAVREDTTAVDVTEEDEEERTEWRRRIRCDDP